MELSLSATSIRAGIDKPTVNYISNIFFGDIAQLIDDHRLYVPNHPDLPDLAQRRPNPTRIKQISDYIIENYQNGTIFFPPICVNVHPQPRYENGKIFLPYHSVSMRLTDGQHRCFGIHRALQDIEQQGAQQKALLSRIEMGILIYSALPLEKERQAFRDQNLLVQRPSVSLSHYFDQRSPHVLITKELIEQVPQFRDNVETIETGLGTHNPKLLTLSTLVTATKFTFPHLKSDEDLNSKTNWLISFWTTTANSFVNNPWQQQSISERKTQRQEDICVSAVVFQALGMIAHDLYQEKITTEKLAPYLAHLKTLDWNKENRFWLDRGVTQIGTKGKPIISNTRTTVKLCHQVLKEHLGIMSMIK